MLICQECGKPAMYQLSTGALICCDCIDRFEFEHNAAMLRFLSRELESTSGMLPSEIQKPKPQQMITLNKISANHSVIEVINAGEAQIIDAELSYAKPTDNSVASKLLQQFAQAVLDSKELDEVNHRAIIEQLAFLNSQLLAKPEHKRFAIVTAVLKDIKETLQAFTNLLTLWETLEPLLRHVLHLSS